MGIQDRKKEHVRITTEEDVEYDHPTGFQQLGLRHNALPETNLEEVSTETSFMGRTFAFPLFISSMTGGHVEAGNVNAIIAEFCEKFNLPFGVGSQRILWEDQDSEKTFSVAREKAPNAFITSNIGGNQLIGGISDDKLNILLESIKADAIIVHLNPLQELLQPEGDRNFKGISDGIKQLVEKSPVPVIVKETGAGIGGNVARRLIKLGVKAIDVAGSGGTSWAKVENRRSSQTNPAHEFDNWGLSTVKCLEEVQQLDKSYREKIELIGSGGIRSSLDIAKSLCLGADFTATASPVIKAVTQGGMEALEEMYLTWHRQMKYILTLLGCNSTDDLKKEMIFRR